MSGGGGAGTNDSGNQSTLSGLPITNIQSEFKDFHICKDTEILLEARSLGRPGNLEFLF